MKNFIFRRKRERKVSYEESWAVYHLVRRIAKDNDLSPDERSLLEARISRAMLDESITIRRLK